MPIPDSLLSASAARSKRSAQERGDAQAAERNQQRTDYYAERSSAVKRGEDPNSVYVPPAVLQDRMLNQSPMRQRNALQQRQVQRPASIDSISSNKVKAKESIPARSSREQTDVEAKFAESIEPPAPPVVPERPVRKQVDLTPEQAAEINALQTRYAMAGARSGYEPDYNFYDAITMRDDPKQQEYEEYFKRHDKETLTAPRDPSQMILNAQRGTNPLLAASLDDGTTANMSARTGDNILGSELKRQIVELGVSGPPLDEIEDNAVYSKAYLMNQYGYIPYIKDTNSYIRMMDQASQKGTSSAFNELAGLRESATNYTVSINGKKFSGKDFDNAVPVYLQNVADQVGQTDGQIYSTQEEAGEGAIPVKVNGSTIYANGEAYNLISSQDPEITETADEIIYTMPDTMETIRIERPDDPNGINISQALNYEAATDGEEPDAWMSAAPIDELRLPDGTALTYNEVQQVLDGGGERDYGFGNIGKPRYDVKGLGSEGWEQDLLPWTLDLILGSAPYFSTPVAVMKAFGDTGTALQGLDPYSVKGGKADRMHENMTDDQFWGNVVGSAIRPAAERFAGQIGGRGLLDKVLVDPVLRRLSGSAVSPALRVGADILGEGIEEVFPGQANDELQNNGFANMFANNVGGREDKKYDKTGHEIRSSDTPFMERLQNYAADAGENFLGGAWLSSLMSVPGLPRTVAQTRALKDTNRQLKDLGLSPMKTPKPSKKDQWQELDDELRAWYDDEGELNVSNN